MTLPHRLPDPDPDREPTPTLHARASDDLHFIRATMERAAAFTAVPGWGGVLMGVIALFAALAAGESATRTGWLVTWICAAALALLVGATDMANKLRAGGNSLLRGPATRFASALVPPVAAGALLTLGLGRAGLYDVLPGAWLLCYGAGVVSAGALSTVSVRWMGACFMLFGAAALLSPASWGNAWMAAGFGGLHVLFGLWITRHHTRYQDG
jgi:hypothetical protein